MDHRSSRHTDSSRASGNPAREAARAKAAQRIAAREEAEFGFTTQETEPRRTRSAQSERGQARAASQARRQARAGRSASRSSLRSHFNVRDDLDSRRDSQNQARGRQGRYGNEPLAGRAADAYQDMRSSYGDRTRLSDARYGDRTRFEDDGRDFDPRLQSPEHAHGGYTYDERFSPRIEDRGSRFSGGGLGYAGGRGNLFRGSTLPRPVALALPIVGAVVVLVLLVYLLGQLSSCISASQDDQPEMRDLAVSYTPSIEPIASLVDPGSTPTGFTLVTEGDSWTPELTDDQSQALTSAISALATTAQETASTNGNEAAASTADDLGFAFVDLTSGSGIAYNLDQQVYGASSFKAHALIYGCQDVIDTGKLALADIQSYAEDAIEWSSNDDYASMRSAFSATDAEGFGTWLENLGLPSDLGSDDNYYPTYTPRQALTLWMNDYLYLFSESSNAETTTWAKSILSNTSVSFIREAIDSTFVGEVANDATDEQIEAAEEKQSTLGTSASASASSVGSSITVYDKAGWIIDTESNCLCDGGIIVAGDKAYLMVVMSGAADGQNDREALERVIYALWSCRDALTPPEQVEAE